MYEKVGGVASVATEVNWKMATAADSLYYFYPIKRPVVDSTHANYLKESDLESSYHKVNYFRVTGATKITDPRIIICSSNKTKIRYYFDTDMEPHIVYGGSGYADGVEFDDSVVNGYVEDKVKNATNKVKIRINVLTGAADKIVIVGSPDIEPNVYYTAGSGSEEPGTEVTGDLKATRTYLYAGITNTYVEPSSTYKSDLKFVSSGNMVIPVPLSTTPELATTYQDEYAGADLYTPYLNTQLQVANSTYDDVGNSPGYRILFMCKIFN